MTIPAPEQSVRGRLPDTMLILMQHQAENGYNKLMAVPILKEPPITGRDAYPLSDDGVEHAGPHPCRAHDPARAVAAGVPHLTAAHHHRRAVQRLFPPAGV